MSQPSATRRPSGARTAGAAALAVGAALLLHAALPADKPPLFGGHGWVGTPLRLVGALVLGAVSCLLLAAKGSPRRLARRLRAVRVGLARPTTGRARIVARVIAEEALWRGGVLLVLYVAFGALFAVGVSSLAFGLSHVHQGLRGMLANCLNGVTFAASYLALGGLAAAVASHAAHNLLLATAMAGRRSQTGRRT
ncbi:CPBP family intramembrane glutamic endopeptidase [Streptomyces sp. DSM 44915]|uniref:CPBP family intramembrane glutamic endopeptidase n=1 Tax=Streptomyces chisholmiae TaxID=3075540 RepID=A0ABU2JND9_9ACTN|nr:CPBP family intramembrane glutamic endopeptidase [Streptomyces sp. DSM 44915]MDT0266507.1 CPBP family intramembrane glutamic endopeptidase [Streptomyces sp. DSM 44915]